MNNIRVPRAATCDIFCAVLNLTRHEQKVLLAVLLLLFIGLTVKVVRSSNSPEKPVAESKR